ncbi:MAG: hypothetical protein JJU33_00420 [Phycisphaerales bacterium]|nr:hypothetical protein [Phycisphaerales bacterium]
MPHVSFAAMSGFRVREEGLAELGMSLPGLQPRARAIAALPPLGLLTLAGMTPDAWSMSLHEAAGVTDDLIERPTLAAV